ncbi:arsenical-resistance protein, partial [Aureobasidium melanogenum]
MATPDDADNGLQPSLQPVGRPLDLVPVQLKEAALDSPTFRAVAVHYANQVEGIEKWLRDYVKQSQKFADRFASIQKEFDNFDHYPPPPPENLSQAVIDHDYTLLAITRYSQNTTQYLNWVFTNVARSRQTMIEPLLRFIDGTDSPLRQFNQARKALERTQAIFDAEMTRYLAQAKTKEASSLREDAFKLHEDRKAYLRASMDYCIMAPNLRNSLDQLLIKVFSDRWKDFRGYRDATSSNFQKWGSELERIRGWSKVMHESESAFKRELMLARRQLEDSAEVKARPSREMDDYAVSTVPYLGSGAPTSPAKPSFTKPEKQGWLFLKTVPPKPARPYWSRRWFIVKNGIFGWLVQGSVSGGVEESEKIGVLLCSVRPAVQEERRFCFEIKTKDTSIILQAETQGELLEWINAFESAKRKALEEPRNSNVPNPGADPAFAISPPVDPSFAAKLTDSLAHSTDEFGGSLSPPELGLASRSSFDVNPSRRSTMLDSEGSRDTANRIIQKLDLHRRGTASSSANQPAPAGGIASLLSASHSILPIGPGPAPTSPHRSFTMPATSNFAPVTLANPPAPTNLSRRAVAVSGQRASSGKSDTSAMPSSLMANLWGSSNWVNINRLGRDEPKSELKSSPVTKPIGQYHDDMAIMEGMEPPKDLKIAELGSNPTPSRTTHRKTVSVGDALDSPSQSRLTVVPVDEPQTDYPVSLKTDDVLVLKEHDAEFHVLFSSVPRSERVVLVFTAMWNPNEQQEFPGRIYVTTEKIYFYSNHFGMVLVAEISLSSITEVTAAPGRESECDYLFLHLKESKTDFRRVTVKTFLDALRPLQRRLDYLVQSANSGRSTSLEDVFASFSKIVTDDSQEHSQGWDDDLQSPTDNDLRVTRRRSRDLRANLRIDGTLYGESVARTGREVTKFKLPSQPVLYKPKDMGDAVLAQDFNISAKALFHVMFGDRSAVFQMLYSNRPIDNILLTPWTQPKDGQLSRQLICAIGPNKETDRQTLDVCNDHLCYVVTQTQSPWQLPMSKNFLLLSKFVITHSAKSKCKLAIFNRVVWNGDAGIDQRLSMSQRLIQKQALRDYQDDAVDLAAVIKDQVSKLGAHSTNKAAQIFGSVGQSTQTSQVSASNLPTTSISRTRRKVKIRTLTNLYTDEVLAQAFRLVTMLIDLFIAIAKSFAGVVTAHKILVLILAFSATYNTWYGYRDGLAWYNERNAGKFMARLGIKPDPTVTRAVYLSDIEEFVAPTLMNNLELNSTILEDTGQAWNTCHGILLGNFVPSTGRALQKGQFVGVSAPIAVGLLVMMYPILCKVQYETLHLAFKSKQLWIQVGFSIIMNWLVAPFLMLGLSWAFLPDESGLREGLILVGIARCIAMVLIWTGLAGGDSQYCAILVAINSILQMVLFAPMAIFFINVISDSDTPIASSYTTVATSVAAFLGIPLAAAIVTRFTIRKFSSTWYNQTFLKWLAPWSLIGLLYTIIVLFASQGHRVVHQIVSVVRVAAPLIVYFFAIFSLTLWVTHKLGFGYKLATTQSFTAASNNFELAIAVATATFGANSDQALAATVGPLIEVPVLLGLVHVVRWIGNKRQWKA